MLVRLFALLLCGASAMAQTGTLVVVNQKQHAVDLVDPVARKILAAVTVGVNGHEIVLSRNGRLAYVPIYSNTGVGKPGTNGQVIDVIDLQQAKIERTIDLGHPVRPHKPVFAPDGLLYVTAELDKAIDVVDVATDTVIGQVPTGAEQSHILGLSPDGRRGYTANVGEGSVSVLDMQARKLIKVIPLTKRVQRIAVSNDGRWVFTSDWDQPRVAVIDTRTDTLSRWIPVEGIPYVTQQTSDGKWLVVSATGKDDKGALSIVDLKTMAVVRTIPVASLVSSFLARDGRIYMSCAANGAIEVLDVREMPEKWTLETPIQLEPGVDGMGWTNVKLEAAK